MKNLRIYFLFLISLTLGCQKEDENIDLNMNNDKIFSLSASDSIFIDQLTLKMDSIVSNSETKTVNQTSNTYSSTFGQKIYESLEHTFGILDTIMDSTQYSNYAYNNLGITEYDTVRKFAYEVHGYMNTN